MKRLLIIVLSVAALAVAFTSTELPSLGGLRGEMNGCPEEPLPAPPNLPEGTPIGPCGDFRGEVRRRQEWFERYTRCIALTGTYPC